MHELSITQGLVEVVLEQAEAHGARKVKRVDIVVGGWTGVVPESVQFYFKEFTAGTVAEGAEVCFELIPARARCQSCGAEFEFQQMSWLCPDCGSLGVDVFQGKELYIDSIDVD